MKLQDIVLTEAPRTLKAERNGIRFPSGEFSSLPNWQKDREDAAGGWKLDMSGPGRDQATAFIDGRGKFQGEINNRLGDSFNSLAKLVAWLNKNGINKFDGLDDTI